MFDSTIIRALACERFGVDRLHPEQEQAIETLLALLRDQERKLRERGVSVVRVDSTVRVEARRQACKRIRRAGA